MLSQLGCRSGIKAGKIDFIKFAALLRATGATAGDLANIFEKRTAVAVLTLGDAAEKAFPTYVSALKDAAGYSAEAGKIMEHTLWGQLQQIKSSWETLTNAIARTFAPGLEDFLESTLRPWINDVTQAWEEGGDTWQEKLRNVWETKLRPVMEEGAASLGDAITSAFPVITKAIGTLAEEVVTPLLIGLTKGVGDLIWKALQGWAAPFIWFGNAVVDVFTSIGRRIEEFFTVTVRNSIFNAINAIIRGLNHLPFVNIAPLEIAQPTSPIEAVTTTGTTVEDVARGFGLSLPGPAAEPAPAAGALPFASSAISGLGGRVQGLESALNAYIDATRVNTDAVAENTDAVSTNTDAIEDQSKGGASQGIVGWVSSLVQKGEDKLAGDIESALINMVTEPITNALETYLAPTATKIGHLAGRLVHFFDPIVYLFNQGLDVITALLGGPNYNEGRYTGAGAYQYAYATGGIAVTPQIARLAESGPEIVLPLNASGGGGLAIQSQGLTVEGGISVYGVSDGEEAGDAIVAELARYEEMTTRQMARSLQMGMLKREAMER